MLMRCVAATGVLLAGLAAATARATTATQHGWRVQSLPAGVSFSEPGLAAGGHGVLLANACTANAGAAATFWQSTDEGRSWSRGFAIGSSAIGCGDADTATGADGYEYALVLGTGVSVYRSRDGRKWSGPATFPPPHGEDQPDRPWLVTVPGRPNVVYMFNSEIGGNIVEWTSTDHGATFTGPVPVTGGSNSQAVLTLGSRPQVDPAHPARMRLFYETAGLGGVAPDVTDGGVDQFPFTQLWQASSIDGGRTWTNTLVLDLPTAFHESTGTLGHLLPAVTIDRNGVVYVVLSVQLGSSQSTHVYLLHSTRSAAWSRPTRIDHAGSSNVYPAVAVSRSGRLFISWYASNAASFNQPDARWHEVVASSDDPLNTHPHVTTLPLGPTVHVGGIEQAGAIGNDVGEDWSLRDFQSLTVDACGAPHVIWASDYRGTRRVFTATTGCS